jgi:uncharacterized protein (DUF4415 family)
MSDKDLNNISRTNWAALEAMEDAEIDYSDIPPLTDGFFEKAILRIPASQAQQLVQIDPDILRWFQSQGGEYKSLINAVLRQYIEASNDPSTA